MEGKEMDKIAGFGVLAVEFCGAGISESGLAVRVSG